MSVAGRERDSELENPSFAGGCRCNCGEGRDSLPVDARKELALGTPIAVLLRHGLLAEVATLKQSSMGDQKVDGSFDAAKTSRPGSESIDLLHGHGCVGGT